MTPSIINIPRTGYRVIYADPPWSFDNRITRAAAVNHYHVLTVEEIGLLPIEEIAAKDSTLFLWTPGSFIPEALRVMEEWGFSYKTVAFTWIKTYKNGQTVNGMGNATRQCCEFVLRGTRGHPKTIGHAVSQEIECLGETIRALRSKHSSKPPVVRDKIEELLGDIPRIELFARIKAPGWDAIGDEIDKKDIRVALDEIIPWIDI